MAELAGEAALSVVELSVDDDADGYAPAHVQVEDVVFVLGLAAGVLGVAAGAGVVFEQHPQADALLDDVAQGLLARREVFVAVAGLGVDATDDADAHAQNLVAVDAAVVDEADDVRADALQTLRTVYEFEIVVYLLLDNVVL